MTTRPTKPNYKRGDVVLVPFPNSDLRSTKLRPAVVVQADNLRTGLAQIVIAMITSNVARAGHPSRVLVPRASPMGRRAGLLEDSVVMTDNLATVSRVVIAQVIGRLPMVDVDKALRHTLEL